MGRENENESNSSIEHENCRPNPDIQCELFQASCILESMIILLKHYKNDLGDDTVESWYGLSLILDGVKDTVVDAHEQFELHRSFKRLGK